MKKLLNFFGLIRLKDINYYLDNEIEQYKKYRKELDNHKDIFYENQTYELSHYRQAFEKVKSDIYFLHLF